MFAHKHDGIAPYFTDDRLENIPHINHAFFGRKGGVSKGIYDSLNVGFGSSDNEASVRENRKRAMIVMGAKPDDLCTIYQIHSAHVETLKHHWGEKTTIQGDGMVTDQPNIVLGILTADCAPVLFADNKRKIIGAAHAGWKGAIGGVLENTIKAMQKLGSEKHNITAAVGPCIKQLSYEVSEDFMLNFIKDDEDNNIYFTNAPKADHYLFDLAGYVLQRLEKAGIGLANALPIDTYGESANFFSYRRKTHHNEPDYGRQLSAIMIK